MSIAHHPRVKYSLIYEYELMKGSTCKLHEVQRNIGLYLQEERVQASLVWCINLCIASINRLALEPSLADHTKNL